MTHRSHFNRATRNYPARKILNADNVGPNQARSKKYDPNLPHVALAASLLERGADFRFPEPSEQARPERVVWGPREVPITDPSQLPEGWSVDEPDLDEA